MQRQRSQEEEEALTKISVNISQGHMGSRRNWSFKVSCKVGKREMKNVLNKCQLNEISLNICLFFPFDVEFLPSAEFCARIFPLGEVSPAVPQSQDDCRVMRWLMCLLRGCRVGHKVAILGLQQLSGSSSQGSQGMGILKSIKAFSLVIYEM